MPATTRELSVSTPARKVSARVGVIGLDRPTLDKLQDCFKQFGIETVPIEGDAEEVLRKQKFEALALRLEAGAEKVLEAARNSPSNRRVVIYGLAEDAKHALQYSRYGINAVIDEPVRRPSALKVVRATYLLVINEFRRYVRLPLMTDVDLEAGARHITGFSNEVSAGGMSLRVSSPLSNGDSVLVSFALPSQRPVKVRAQVCWAREGGKTVGVRFDLDDDRRYRVKDWVDDYLGIG